MDPNDEKYYRDLIDMFQTDGWRALTGDLQAGLEVNDTVRGCTTIEELHCRRGQMEVLERLINLPQSIDAMYEQAREDVDA